MNFGPCRVCGHDRRGDNLLEVRRSNGTTDYRCRRCHNRRQLEYHNRKKARAA